MEHTKGSSKSRRKNREEEDEERIEEEGEEVHRLEGETELEASLQFVSTFVERWDDKRRTHNQHEKRSKRPKLAATTTTKSPKHQSQEEVNVRVLSQEDYDELDEHLHVIQQFVTENGLTAPQLHVLANLAFHVAFDEHYRHILLYSLIPREFVSADTIVNVMGYFGSLQGADHLGTKAVLLKWIILVYDLVEPKDVLHHLYPVFFHYLDYESLRPYLCHLLYRLTRREDVVPFRIRRYTLQERAGEEPYLVSLLILYKEYYNDMVYVNKSKKRLATTTIFKNPDRKWHSTIIAVQSKHNENYTPRYKPFGFSSQNIGLSFVHNVSISERNLESVDVAPDAVTLVDIQQQEHLVLQQKRPFITLEQISSVEELASNIEHIKLPNHLASVLNNRFLQHYITLQANKGSLLRLSHWLSFVLTEEFNWKSHNADQRATLLEKLANFTGFTRETIPLFLPFISQYLKTWSSVNNIDAVLSLLSKIPPCSFEDLYSTILKPIGTLYFTNIPIVKAKIIRCYTDLLRSWVSINWQEHYGIDRTRDTDLEVVLRSAKSYAFTEIEEQIDHCKTIFEFIKYVDQLSVLGLQTEKDHPAIQHAVLSFYEVVTQLNTTFQLPFVEPPSAQLVGRVMLSSSAMAISRICAILVHYKAAFAKLKEGDSKFSVSFPSGIKKISKLNTYIWTLCTALWQNKLLAEENQKTKELIELPKDIIKQLQKDCPDLSRSLSLTRSLAFSSLAWEYLKHVERKLAPGDEHVLDPTMIKDNIRPHYIEFLKAKGLDGLSDFLYNFIGTLANKRQEERQ